MEIRCSWREVPDLKKDYDDKKAIGRKARKTIKDKAWLNSWPRPFRFVLDTAWIFWLQLRRAKRQKGKEQLESHAMTESPLEA